MSHIDMHSGISVVLFTSSMFIFMPGILLPQLSLWFCLCNQSAMKRSGPGLYSILTLYWCILSSVHWSPYNSVAASFWRLPLMVCDQWWYSRLWWSNTHETSEACIFLQCFFFYPSVLVKTLPCKCYWSKYTLSGVSSCEHLIPSLVCSTQLLSQFQMHLFPSIAVLSCQKISCRYCLYYFLSLSKISDGCHSMSNLFYWCQLPYWLTCCKRGGLAHMIK